MSNTLGSHGAVGRREAAFTRLFPKRLQARDPVTLKKLAQAMIGNAGDTASNTPDGEENLAVPAGYTYLGQFIDHDLTFDTTSSFNSPSDPSNLRTPRFDLDNIYGSGPDDQPYLYATADANGMRRGASLVLGRAIAGSPNRHDLLRIGTSDDARAVIGDPRNDENAIVCNLQAAFIQFHNAVVTRLAQEKPTLSGKALFVTARKLVRWTYQRIVVEDYAPRIIEPATYLTFRHRLEAQGEGAFMLFKAGQRSAIPIEFAGAAYRFGHSMVRTGYKLNAGHTPQLIFTPGQGIDSLMGFGKLSDSHWIEWKRFFPKDNQFKAGAAGPAQNTDVALDRLQWAYRIDTALVDPLRILPDAISKGDSLADLNLRRSDLFRLVGGQTVADALGVARLDPKYLVLRSTPAGPYGYTSLADISPALMTDTPLWTYILCEAQTGLVDAWLQKNGGATGNKPLDDDDLLLGVEGVNKQRHRAPIAQLGPVGGMILLETFYGLLLADPDSFLSITSAEDQALSDAWFAFVTKNGTADVSMWRLLEVAGVT